MVFSLWPLFRRFSRQSERNNKEAKREIAAVQTAQAAGVNPESVPEEVMGALTKDYSGVMKALKKRDGKEWV